MPEPEKPRPRRWQSLVNFIKSPTHAYPLTLLLAYAVLFGLYDRRWVPQQRAAVLDQSFRRLALAADQIRSRLENIARVLEAEADRKDRSYSRSADNTKHGQARNAEQTAPVRDFDFIKHCEKRPDVKEGLSFRILAGDKPAIFASLKRGETIVCGESPLEATIESATRDLVGTGFDDVAVITSTGRVIYQNQSSALRMATLGDLAATTMPAKRAASDDKGASSEKNEASAPSGVSYSRVADLSFAERKYKLLLQPIVLPVSDVATGADAEKVPSLELVGLIDEATLTTAARSLPYDWLINVTGLILLALVLTWPLLKISKMGPAEGFRPGETLAFGLSMLAATILVTVLAYYNSQVFSYQSMDDSLQRLAQSIDTHFTQEVTEALRTLKQLSEDPELQQELAKTLDKKEADRFQADPGVLVHKKVFNSPSTSQNKYQWFDQVFWVDEEGNQVLKWSSRSTPTGRTNVSSEPWFRNAKQGRFWTIDCVDPAPNSFVLDSVYSPNTTDYFGVIARVQPFRNTRLIATMATPFVSVINPLLSPMDGFAILDEKGVVRFHSDAAKNLRENFLNEIRPSQGMRSAIAARMPEVFTVHYSARKYRMRVQPISFDGNEAWTLIVFRDFTLRQRFFLNTLVLTVIYIAAYLCALSVLVAAGISVIRFLATRANLKAKEDWLRPTVNERFILWALVGLFALLLVLFRFLTGADHSQRQYLATVLGLPFTGLLAAYFALRYPSSLGWLGRAGELKPADCDSGDILCVTRKTKALNARKRIGIGNVLVFALTLLLTLVSVFPTAEFFEIAFSDSVVPNMEDLQVETARNVLARNNRIYAYVRSVATPSGSNFLQTRLSESMDRYTLQTDSKKSATTGVKLDAWLPNSIQTHWRGALGVPPLGSWLFANIAGVLKRVLPFPEEVRDGDRVGGSWNWTKGEWVGQPELEMLPPQHDPLDPRIEDDSFNRPQLPTAAMSDFPIANVLVPFRHQNSCGLLLIGLVVCLFGFTHYTVLRRFGLDFRPALEPLLEATLPGLAEHTTRNVLALNFPRTVNGQALNPLNAPGVVQVFPLESLLAGDQWKEQLDDRTELIVVSSFEEGIADSSKNEKTLELLEEIVEDPKRKLLLVSTMDPVYFLYSGRLRDPKKWTQSELKAYSRWLNVLNSFETYRVSFQGGKEFSQEDWHALWDTCSQREQLALWQLAKYRLINPKNTDAVEHLYRRGILIYAEHRAQFQVFHSGFQRFILSEPTSRQIELLMDCHKDTAWAGLKLVLIYTGLALPLFLAFTMADFWDLGIAKLMTIGTAGTAALQAISKVSEMAGSVLGKKDIAA